MRASTTAIIKALVIFGGCTFAAAPSAADEPLRPAHRYTKCSASGAYCVTSDPIEGTFGHPPGEATPASWRIHRWFRVVYLSDDGQHLVTGFDGMNLVPTEDPEQTKIVEFWNEGQLAKSYTLSDLGYEQSDLQRTVSHYHWGGYGGFDADGNFSLVMLDDMVIVFDVATGELLNRSRRAA